MRAEIKTHECETGLKTHVSPQRPKETDLGYQRRIADTESAQAETGTHSPLPWQIINGAVFDADGHMVYASDSANANIIVASVNHAERLSEALKTAADWLSRSVRIDDQEQAQDAREALAQWEQHL